MAHGINPTVNRVQPASSHPPAHRLPTQPQFGELAEAHDAVLAARDLGQRGHFVTHTVT